jgi:hypothetical protein
LERTPDKWSVFFEKIIERAADLGEVFNEVSIEVGKTDEALYFFEVLRNRPINNSFNLD